MISTITGDSINQGSQLEGLQYNLQEAGPCQQSLTLIPTPCSKLDSRERAVPGRPQVQAWGFFIRTVSAAVPKNDLIVVK